MSGATAAGRKTVRILDQDAARRSLLASLALSAEAAGATLGPAARSVMVDRSHTAPALLTEGSAIATEAAGSSGIQSLGARLLKEALFDMERDLGDGTASLAVMTAALLRGGIRAEAAGIHPQQMGDAFLAESARLVRALERHRIVCEAGMHRDIAVSASGDGDLAATIAQLFAETGTDGVIDIRPSDGRDDVVLRFDGFSFNAELVSPDLATERSGSTVFLSKPHFLVVDDEISDFGKLLPILDGFVRAKKALVIVARDVTGEARRILIRNWDRQDFGVTAVKVRDVLAEGYAVLEDVAIATGAEFITGARGLGLDSVKPGMLGRGVEFILSKEGARIVAPEGNATAIAGRRRELKAAAQRQKYLSLDRERLERRAACLGSCYRRVHVGGATLPERETRVSAARRCAAALRLAGIGGVVPGGGAVFLRLAQELDGQARGTATDRAIRDAIAGGLRSVPARIVGNAGLEPAEWLGKVAAHTGPGIFGIDVLRRKVVGMAGSGIWDPLPVVGAVIQRSFSLAATILRCAALVG